jgi:hypothetical protein
MRKPEFARPFSGEYKAATGWDVHRMFDGPFREFVDAQYVEWLEQELLKARKLGGKRGA